MAKAQRQTSEGIYHVMARSNAEEAIFRVTADFVDFVTIVAGLSYRTLHAFCVMPTHYHLLCSFDDGELSGTIRRLNRRYASRFNERHARRGKVFDSPFGSVPVESQEHLVWLVNYIAQNPTEPETWPWSSFVTEFSFVDDSLLVEIFGSREAMLRYAFEPRRNIVSAPSASATRSKPLRS